MPFFYRIPAASVWQYVPGHVTSSGRFIVSRGARLGRPPGGSNSAMQRVWTLNVGLTDGEHEELIAWAARLGKPLAVAVRDLATAEARSGSR